MTRDETRFEALVAKRLAEVRQEKLEAIGVGVDPEMYKYWTGYIRCIKDVSSIMEEVRKKLNQD